MEFVNGFKHRSTFREKNTLIPDHVAYGCEHSKENHAKPRKRGLVVAADGDHDVKCKPGDFCKQEQTGESACIIIQKCRIHHIMWLMRHFNFCHALRYYLVRQVIEVDALFIYIHLHLLLDLDIIPGSRPHNPVHPRHLDRRSRHPPAVHSSYSLGPQCPLHRAPHHRQ